MRNIYGLERAKLFRILTFSSQKNLKIREIVKISQVTHRGRNRRPELSSLNLSDL